MLEALVGAVFMDQGYERARKFILTKILPEAQLHKIEKQISSYKAEMIRWCQKHHKIFRFDVHSETDAQNKEIYFVQLFIDGRLAGRGRAHSIKRAEEIAAKNAYRALVRK